MTQCEQENLDLPWASKTTEECSKMLFLQSKGQGLLATHPVLPNTALKLGSSPQEERAPAQGGCPVALFPGHQLSQKLVSLHLLKWPLVSCVAGH